MKYSGQQHGLALWILMIIMSTNALGCGGLNKPLGITNEEGTESDEEAESYIQYALQRLEDDEHSIEGHQREIATRRGAQENLGKHNVYLQDLIKEKEEETNRILRQMHDDSAQDYDLMRQGCPKCTFTVDCQKCHRHVELTFSRFKELVAKYRTGYTYQEQYRWFLWWEWGHHQTNYTFNKCFRCMQESDVAGFEKSINENADALARLESEIVYERALQDNLTLRIQDNTLGLQSTIRLSASRQRYRSNEAAARQRADAAEAELARERERMEQTRQELQQQMQESQQRMQHLARILLESGAAIEMVMHATGLTQEELTDMQYEIVSTHNTASGT